MGIARHRGRGPVVLDEVPDEGAADPAEAAAEAEERAARAPARRTREDYFDARLDQLRPRVLLGQGLAWRAWAVTHPAACPACKGSPLGPAWYCLVCDRWGLDHLLRAAAQAAGRKAYVRGRYRGGIGA
jgi:hypothetical protein